MKIWLVNHYALPPTETGGTRHFTLARELMKLGHEVTIFASSFDHFARKETRLAPGETFKVETFEGVPFVWLRTPPYPGNTLARMWNMAYFGWQFFRLADRLPVERPDVVIGSSPHLFAALAAERVARRHRVPFLLEVRDLWPQSLVDLSNISERHPAIIGLERIERYLYRHSARIISLLPGAAGHMAEKGADPARVLWLPNGVDAGLAPEPSPGAAQEAFTVMFAGAHGVANGLDAILDTARLLRGEPVRFRLIGQGPEKERLMKRAEDEGLTNVTFDAPVPKEQIYGVLAQADAFLMILKDSPVFRWGVSPNKLFDYMAMARPVVFGVSTPFNPIDDAKAGLTVPPEDPAAMAEAIRALMAMSPEARWEMGLRGAAYVKENHDFGKLAARLDAALREVVR